MILWASVSLHIRAGQQLRRLIHKVPLTFSILQPPVLLSRSSKMISLSQSKSNVARRKEELTIVFIK